MKVVCCIKQYFVLFWGILFLTILLINIFLFFFKTCICANRILIQDKIYDEFASKFAEAVDKQMKVGNGMEASSTQGPLINQKAIEKVWYFLEK